jgi:hypothetical protein
MGVRDTRRFVLEPARALPLRVVNRAGNPRSAMRRQAWDGGTVRTLATHSPLQALRGELTAAA